MWYNANGGVDKATIKFLYNNTCAEKLKKKQNKTNTYT